MIKPFVTAGAGNNSESVKFAGKKIVPRIFDDYLPVFEIIPAVKGDTYAAGLIKDSYTRLKLVKQEDKLKAFSPFIRYFAAAQFIHMNWPYNVNKEDIYKIMKDPGGWKYNILSLFTTKNMVNRNPKRFFPQVNNASRSNYRHAVECFNSIHRHQITIGGLEGPILSGSGFLGLSNPAITTIQPLVVLYVNKKYLEYYDLCISLGEIPDKRIFKVHIQKDFDSSQCPENLTKLRTAYRKHLKDQFEGVEVVEMDNLLDSTFCIYRLYSGNVTLKQINEKVQELGEEALNHIKVEEEVRRRAGNFAVTL